MIKEAIEGAKLLITLINVMSEDRGLKKILGAHLNASQNILNEIEKNKLDDKFVLNSYVRLLTNLELIYFAIKDGYDSDSINKACFYIALSHRILNSPEDVIRKWAIINRRGGGRFIGFNFIEDWKYIKFVLGDCYDEYYKQYREEKEDREYKWGGKEWDLLDMYR